MMPQKAKRDNFISATARLAESIAEHTAAPTDTVRDGVIQRFEFTFELSWKALKEHMQDQGSTADMQFPKQILKEAYAAKLIHHEEIWLEMLADRNTTSHIYDNKIAAKIAQNIEQKYLPEFQTLASFFK